MDLIAEKILIVDDDRSLLDAFQSQFQKRLKLETATSGEDGIQAITNAGPFAVVISNVKMPNMNGIEFLTRVRFTNPDTVRILLTGNPSLEVAIQAINEANVFRFLNKPVDGNVLYEAIIDGIQQYRIITAERVLLNKTLKGVVDLLADMLNLVNPEFFSQASRIKQHVRTLVKRLDLADGWNYELAAMLSQLGYVTLPGALLEKIDSDEELTAAEIELFEKHPQTSSRLLKHIPKLETVAAIVEHQAKTAELIELEGKLTLDQKAVLGGQILRVSIGYEEQLKRGLSPQKAIEYLGSDPEHYDPLLVAALTLGNSSSKRIEVYNLPLDKLEIGMTLMQAIRTSAGTLLVAKGQPVSHAIKMRLQVVKETGLIDGTYRAFRVVG